MPDPKKTRYLRYSAELVVVFLGVFLGLLAENYREGWKERSDEEVSLDRIIRDLGFDRNDMIGNLQRTESSLASALWLLDHADVGGVHRDSLAYHVGKFQQTSRFVRNASEYSALKSAGRINIVEDSDFRQRLTEYYESFPFIDRQHDNDHEQVVAAMHLVARYVRMSFIENVLEVGTITRNDGIPDTENVFPEVTITGEPSLILSESNFLLAVSRTVTARLLLVDEYRDKLEDNAQLQEDAGSLLGRD